MNIGVAVLAGGQGQRLGGRDKAQVRVGGRTILARQVDVLAPEFPWRVLVREPPALPETAGWAHVSDRRAGILGPLAGLEAALATAANEVDALVLVACDLPFLQTGVLRLLRQTLATAPDVDAVVPLVENEPQPLLGAYRSDLLPLVSALLDRGVRSMRGLLSAAHVHWLDEARLRVADPALRSFFNVNTPEALKEAERLAR